MSSLYHRALLYASAALIVTLALFAIFGERGALHLWRLRQEKRKIDEKNFLLQRENELLRERIYRLRHDDLYLEKVAREELGLVRPGEILYRFVSPESRKEKPITGAFESLRSSEQRERR